MKIIDILNEIANGTLEKGFTFEYDMQEWIFDGKEITSKLAKSINLFTDYYVEKILNDEVAIIVEDENLKELKDNASHNEIIYKINRILKEIKWIESKM